MSSLLEELRPDVHDERVLAAIAAVPREAFVAPPDLPRAWENRALPIGEGQTISQPLVVARMCELLELRGDERVLDVGTGSGYHAAVLAQLVASVHTIEVVPALADAARERLAGLPNVTCAVGDGARGLPEAAPFDAINVAAASDRARLDPLLEQLTAAGRAVAPVNADTDQVLTVLRADGSTVSHERVRFVPLVEK